MRLLVVSLLSFAFVNPAAHAQSDGDLGAGLVGGLIGGIIARNPNASSSDRIVRRSSAATRANGRYPSSRVQVRNFQTYLNVLGFQVGRADGVAGRNTRRAVQEFQTSIGSAPTGRLTNSEYFALQRAAGLVSETDATREFALGVASERVALENAILQSASANAPTNVSAQAPAAGALSPSRPATAQGSGAANGISTPVARPTRKFAGPGGYPPEDFRGYGVIAFKSTVSDYDRGRFKIICSAYSAAMIASSSSGSASRDQFVTIWPVENDSIADALNGMPQTAATNNCPLAIDYYDKARAEATIAAARKAGFSESGVGPFLIGWLPSNAFGKKDALILFLDLSKVQTYAQAQSLFSEWKRDIESDPELLRRGFSIELLRRKMRRWLDQNGEGFLKLVAG